MTRDISAEAKQTCANQVIESVCFARAGQLRRMLRWLTNQAIDGAAGPTEHEVAVHALGCDSSFDPQTDSLVRKEMSRLRAKLREYYANEGSGDRIQIKSHDGYRLTFHAVRAAEARKERTPEGVCLLLLPFLSPHTVRDFAEEFYDRLFLRFSEIEQLAMVARTTSRLYGEKTGDIRDFALETGADYLIEGTVRPEGAITQVVLWLADGRSGHTLLASKVSGSHSEQMSELAATHVVERLFRGG